MEHSAIQKRTDAPCSVPCAMITALRARGSLETRPLNPLTSNPQRFRPMPTDFSTIDLGTINAAHDVIVCRHPSQGLPVGTGVFRSRYGRKPHNAVMVKHWAFAADILSTTISTEFTNLFSKALNARFGDLTPTTHRSSRRSGAGCGGAGGGRNTGGARTGCRMMSFKH